MKVYKKKKAVGPKPTAFNTSTIAQKITDRRRILETVRMMVASGFEDIQFLHPALRIYPVQMLAVLNVRNVAVGISRDRYDQQPRLPDLRL